MTIEIRTERPNDYEQVFQLNVRAFDNRVDESKLIERIRASAGFIPELSLVAEENGRIVGHALFSKAEVTDGADTREVIVLAPIAVEPDRQRSGIGARLIEEGLRRSAALGYDFVFLIGHPRYYPKFGFQPARAHGFELTQYDVPDPVFMVRELTPGKLGQIKGELRYPETFGGV